MTAFLLVGLGVGAILGSFSQAVSDRVSDKKTLWGRSYCERCKKTLSWYDLFPIFSYILLRGRCRYCRKKIPIKIWLVEIVTAILIGLVFYFTLPHDLNLSSPFNLVDAYIFLNLVFRIFVTVILVILFLIDLKVGLLPDGITLLSSVVALGYLVLSSALRSWIFYQSLLKSPLAPYLMPPRSDYLYQHLFYIWQPAMLSVGTALLLSGLFLLLILLTKGRGMGGGDIKYILFLGLALGFPQVLAGIFLAFALGATTALFLIILGKKRFGQTVPFGPFLSIGSYVALLFGNQIISWYLNSFKLV